MKLNYGLGLGLLLIGCQSFAQPTYECYTGTMNAHSTLNCTKILLKFDQKFRPSFKWEPMGNCKVQLGSQVHNCNTKDVSDKAPKLIYIQFDQNTGKIK